jgi:periplasmic protein TonB
MNISFSSETMTLDDYVFAQRNQQYGGYALRQAQGGILQRAFWAGALLFVLAVTASAIAMKTSSTAKKGLELVLTDFDFPEPKKPVVVPPPPAPPVAQPIAMDRFLPPKIVETPIDETPIHSQEELGDALIGNKNQEGVPAPNEVFVEPDQPQPEPPVAVEPESEKPFLSVEVMPEFAGGTKALMAFLSKNLQYPSHAARTNTSGRVYVEFVISKTGEVQEEKVLKGAGFGMDEEALRVVKLMPRWNPGKQSGRAVAVRYTLPITFQLE